MIQKTSCQHSLNHKKDDCMWRRPIRFFAQQSVLNHFRNSCLGLVVNPLCFGCFWARCPTSKTLSIASDINTVEQQCFDSSFQSRHGSRIKVEIFSTHQVLWRSFEHGYRLAVSLLAILSPSDASTVDDFCAVCDGVLARVGVEPHSAPVKALCISSECRTMRVQWFAGGRGSPFIAIADVSIRRIDPGAKCLSPLHEWNSTEPRTLPMSSHEDVKRKTGRI